MYEKLYDSGRMPRTKALVEALANNIEKTWKTLVLNHAPRWWGRMAFYSNEIIIKNIPGGKEVFWKPIKSGIDFMGVVEKGRKPFNIKNALLNGPRARQGKNGRYTIVPFQVSKGERGKRGSNVTGEIKKVGEFKDASGVLRNKYTYKKSKKAAGNIYKSKQEQKNGPHYSYMKFVAVSEKSSWGLYPEIRPGNYSDKLQSMINKTLSGSKFKAAVALDIRDLLEKKA